jgi:hypothetical protein
VLNDAAKGIQAGVIGALREVLMLFVRDLDR